MRLVTIAALVGVGVLTGCEAQTVPELCVAAWLDTNRNGKVDSGDAVGQLAVPYPAQPSKFFSSNRYASPPVVLETVR